MTSALRRAAGTAGRVAWSFLVDDTPEVLVVAVVVVGTALALRPWHDAAVVVLPLVTAAGLATLVWRAYRCEAKGRGVAPRPPTPGAGPGDTGAT